MRASSSLPFSCPFLRLMIFSPCLFPPSRRRRRKFFGGFFVLHFLKIIVVLCIFPPKKQRVSKHVFFVVVINVAIKKMNIGGCLCRSGKVPRRIFTPFPPKAEKNLGVFLGPFFLQKKIMFF